MAGRNGTRVVVTGVGVVSPIGIGNDRFWDSLVNNRTGIDFLQSMPSDGLPSAFGAEVRDFNPVNFLRDKKFVKVMCRDIRLLVWPRPVLLLRMLRFLLAGLIRTALVSSLALANDLPSFRAGSRCRSLRYRRWI